MRRKLRQPVCAFVLGATLVGAAFGGKAAYAAITGEDVIRACYKSNGVLYVVGVAGAPATCGVGDVPLSWGMQGPQGETGAPGTFTGQFRSPNGEYTLDVNDRGIRMAGPGGRVEIGSHGVKMNGVLYARIGARQIALGGNCGRLPGTRKVVAC
jgi:hypothetical protein